MKRHFKPNSCVCEDTNGARNSYVRKGLLHQTYYSDLCYKTMRNTKIGLKASYHYAREKKHHISLSLHVFPFKRLERLKVTIN